MSGIDSDLQYCLMFNPQDGFEENDIADVLAVWEGEYDGGAWRWVVVLNDGRFVFIWGSCDYTGWDCISSAYSVFESTPEQAAKNEGTEEVTNALLEQIEMGKRETWREKTDKVMGVDSTDPAAYVDPNLDGAL